MTLTIEIQTPANFAFEATVVSHGWYLLAPFRWDRQTRVLHRVEDIDGRVFELQIRQGAAERLVVESASSLERAERKLRERLTRMFQLHVDTTEFLTLCQSSPAHLMIARTRFGRMLCGSTLFEDVVKVITTTNTTWQQTMRMVQRLVDRYGRRGAFPSPRAIAYADSGELRKQCRLGYRSKAIHTLAKGIVEGLFDLRQIADPSQTSLELFKSYQSLPGIGPYGAAHLLAMDGRYDFIAVDTEFRRFVRDRHYKGRKVSDRTMVRRYARWGRWQYLAYWSELWSSVAPRLEEFEKGLE